VNALSGRASAPPERLDLSTRLYCGIGAIAYGIKDGGFSILLLLFYNQVVGLPAQTVGFAIMLALVLDAFIDPLIGHASDHLRSRWGRRHPFMYVAALPASLAYLALWFPPSGSYSWQVIHLVCVAMLARSFISLFELPSSAMMPELTKDYDERTSLTSFRYLFGAVGGLGMAVFTFNVLLRPDATHPVGQLNPNGYHLYGLIASGTMFLVVMISALGTHRHIPRFSVPPRREKMPLKSTFREVVGTLSNRSLLALLASMLFGSMGSGLSTALGVYLNTYFWGLSAAAMSLFLIAQAVATALAFFLAAPLARRLGKKPAALVMLPMGIVLLNVPILLRLAGLFLSNESHFLLPVLLAIHTVSMTAILIFAILMPSMGLDVVEDSAVSTGRRSEGLIMAAGVVMQKAVSGLGIFLASLVLTLAHFPEHATPGQIDPDIIWRLGAAYSPSMFLIYALCMLSLGGYRITRTRHEENLRRLADEAAIGGVLSPDAAAGLSTLANQNREQTA
jgi:GPH family glycoside/pentoside/hexuronide:cation symporter